MTGKSPSVVIVDEYAPESAEALAERAAVVAFGRRYVAAVTAIAGKGRLGTADRVHELVGQVTAFIDQIEQGLHVDEGALG